MSSSITCHKRLLTRSAVARLVLVDAMALLYRAHFGFGAMRLATTAGEDTSVAYGLIGMLLNLLELVPPPTHFAVVFDAAGKTFRHAHPPLRVARTWPARQ